MNDDWFCSQRSRQIGEQIIATALPEVRLWLALEVPLPWGARALEESELPPPAKSRLLAWQQELPGTRVHFIKQQAPDSGSPDGFAFFAARTDDRGPQLFRFSLPAYEALLDIDLPALAAGDPSFAPRSQADPIFLVCTNGRRDRCCAKWGLPFYFETATHAGENAWRTTHTGGHRFAPTLVSLPHGVCYGWLQPEESAALVAATRAGRVFNLSRYRGRATYPRVVQAAEAFLRERTGEMGLSSYHWIDHVQTGDDRWEVRFSSSEPHAVHHLHVAVDRAPPTWPLSCGKPPSKPHARYNLEGYEFHSTGD